MKFAMDLDIGSFSRPLVLISDDGKQTLLDGEWPGYVYPPGIGQPEFSILATGMREIALLFGFEYMPQPAYSIFENNTFTGIRKSFWQPALAAKFPIFIVSALFGLLWPGVSAGIYNVKMRDAFPVWLQLRLYNVVKSIYNANDCDCVVSYLPTLYDNIVHLPDVPWIMCSSSDFVSHTPVFLNLIKNREVNGANPQEQRPSKGNILDKTEMR